MLWEDEDTTWEPEKNIHDKTLIGDFLNENYGHLKNEGDFDSEHTECKELAEKCIKVVDSFHFGEVKGKHPGHKDKWCRAHCNPYHYTDLVDHGNMSICEQSFSKWKRYSRLLRHMNAQRFNFMLLLIVWWEHEKWENK